jgi:zinc protease
MIAALVLLLAADAGVAGPGAHMAQKPVIGPLPALRLTAPTTFALGNGLRVIALPQHAAPIVALQLVVRSGSDADPPALAGLAAATADMMDEGAGSRDALAIARDLETLGAELFLGASRDGSTLSLSVPAPGFEPALAIAADVVLRPTFAEADWSRVQNDRLTSLIQRRDQPEAVAVLVADRVLFGDEHPYGRPAAGYEKTVRAITAADLRRHYQKLWRPNNASLVVVGDFEPDRLKAALEQAFGAWKKGPVPASRAAPPRKQRPRPEGEAETAGSARSARARLVLVDKPGAPQTVLRLVGPGAARSSPDRPPLSLLATVLGGSFTSRLNFNLREQKGYTYGAGSSFQFLRRPGPFSAAASVFTKVTDAALGEFLKELGALRTGEVTAEELTKARAMQQQRLAEALSTTGGTAGTFADISLYGLPLDEPVRFTKALEKADARLLKRLANRSIDPATITIVAVGDRSVIAPGFKALGLPEPELRDADGEVVR